MSMHQRYLRIWKKEEEEEEEMMEEKNAEKKKEKKKTQERMRMLRKLMNMNRNTTRI